jgi:hypothetical protein
VKLRWGTRCGSCDYWKHGVSYSKKAGVCMFHSFWVQDTREPRSGSKRSRRGKDRFKSVITRYTNLCEYWIPLLGKEEDSD